MRIKLATKFVILVSAVLALAVLSGSVALYSAWKLESLLQTTVAENLSSVRAAEELEIALLDQRGLVSAYILDELEPTWLERLKEVEPQFSLWLGKARQTAHSGEELAILDRLETVYKKYHAKRQDVIDLSHAGKLKDATRVLLDEVQQSYRDAYRECESFLEANERSVSDAVVMARRRVQNLTVIVASLAVITVVSSGALVWLFYGSVLRPLRRMVAEMRTFSDHADVTSLVGGYQDELSAIHDYLSSLMSDVAGARSTLEIRQNQLEQAQKLASVGKLAASVAHEIRNPLTAMKMWLFSLRKSVGVDPNTDRKFDLIGGELTRLEAVVQNFLVFSRPSELKTQSSSVAALVEKTLELLGPKLAERQVIVSVDDLSGLPSVLVDPEQMKQVLINLLMNAAEAMSEGGEIAVSASRQTVASGPSMIVVRIRDRGCGISDGVRGLIFQPFFTTKEHGTGLGLCIAAQILASHSGRLTLESTSNRGSCFAMWIPCQ